MYDQLNLKSWPFQVVPDADSARIWAGRRQTRQQLERLLRKMQLAPASALRLFWANFGMGKTHTLMHLCHLCRQTKNHLIPVYAVMPKQPTKFLDVYRAIAMELPYAFLGEQLVKVGNNVGGSVKTSPLFAKAPGVDSALLAMRKDDSELETIARQWLAAQPGLSKPQLKAIDVNYVIKTPEEAINALTALTKLATFKIEPVGKLVIMLDEFQRIGELRPGITRDINTALHTYFNENAKGLELFLTFSFGRQDNVKFLLSSEIQSRADTETISLDALTEREGAEFLQDLLGQFRVKPDDRWAYPFTPEAVITIVKHIATHKQVTPRRIIKLADYLLREQLLADNSPIEFSGITSVEASRILSDPEIAGLDADDVSAD